MNEQKWLGVNKITDGKGELIALFKEGGNRESFKEKLESDYNLVLQSMTNSQQSTYKNNFPKPVYKDVTITNLQIPVFTTTNGGGKLLKSSPKYKKTSRKFTKNGSESIIYTKDGDDYIKKKNKTTGKFSYKKV